MATGSYYSSGYSSKKSIDVEKGTPTNAKYAVFYAIDEDPVIFCKTYEVMKKEVAKLRKNKDVKKDSIKVFSLIKA